MVILSTKKTPKRKRSWKNFERKVFQGGVILVEEFARASDKALTKKRIISETERLMKKREEAEDSPRGLRLWEKNVRRKESNPISL